MVTEIYATGKTANEALEALKAKLGVSNLDDIEWKLVNAGKKGKLFGIGARLAKVVAFVEAKGEAPAPKEMPKPEAKAEAKPAPAPAAKSEAKPAPRADREPRPERAPRADRPERKEPRPAKPRAEKAPAPAQSEPKPKKPKTPQRRTNGRRRVRHAPNEKTHLP